MTTLVKPLSWGMRTSDFWTFVLCKLLRVGNDLFSSLSCRGLSDWNGASLSHSKTKCALRQRQPKRLSAATLVPHVCVADAHVDVCMRVRACMATSMHMYT